MTGNQQNLALDHVVLVVTNLDAAIAQFESNGFTVTEGGTNGPTHNALIAFADNTYIELIALQSRTARLIFRLLRVTGLLALRRLLIKDLNNRLFRWFSAYGGFRDICFRISDFESFQRSCEEKRISITPIAEFCRTRPDGIDVRWRLAGAQNLDEAFFIQDITPLDLRVPSGQSRQHANGATGIARITTKNPLETRPVDIECRADQSLGNQKLGITLRTTAMEKPRFTRAQCCGASIGFE